MRFKIFLIIFLSVIVSGTVGFMIIEDLSLADALYFSIVTLATVGYGDIHPVTLPGKIFAIVMIVMGVGTFLGVVANATEMMLNKREKIRIIILQVFHIVEPLSYKHRIRPLNIS